MEQICQADLQALLDREAIRDCLNRYCRGIDRADEELLRGVYWPDARDSHGAYVGTASGFVAVTCPLVRAAYLLARAFASLPQIEREPVVVEFEPSALQHLFKLAGVARYGWTRGASRLSVLGMAYRNRWNATDQIPLRAVDSGLIGRLGPIEGDDGGDTERSSLSASWSSHVPTPCPRNISITRNAYR